MQEAVISLPSGRDHASLALLPFAKLGEEDRRRPQRIAYQAIIEGRKRRVEVTLSPGAEVGLPLPGDQIVYLALLQQLAGRSTAAGKMCFRTRELAHELGMAIGGSGYARLRAALERLVQVTVTVDESWSARDGAAYRRRTQAAHLLDAYHLSSQADETSWIEWGYIVREAFELGDLKRLDWELTKRLSHPAAIQLYRFLDRAVLGGETRYEIDWVTLATAVGMSANYARPALFKQKIESYLETLVDAAFLESWRYERGGVFVFQLPNYLRASLRTCLQRHGVFPEVARQLVGGYDETRILLQLDCLPHRGAREQGGYLTQAVRYNYPLQYPADERAAFLALFELLSPPEREAYHRAALRLLGANLFDAQADPASWTTECRAVIRFLVTENLEPDSV